MNGIFQSLLLFFATGTDRAAAEQLQYLKVENEILRGKLPKRIHVTAAERRRLVKFGKPLGSAIKDLISIVAPRTFARWLSGVTERRSRLARLRSGSNSCCLPMTSRRPLRCRFRASTTAFSA